MQFYVSKNGEQLGPLSLLDVRERLKSGAFAYTDLAWRDGMKDWAPLSDLMGGALPDATPHAVSTWTSANKPAPKKAPTVARILTAIGLFFPLLIATFTLIFFVACIIFGFVGGVQAGLQGNAHGANVADASKAYMPMLMGVSALLSLAVSAIVSWLTARSNLFPWCRPK
jgi:hypothetical protein